MAMTLASLKDLAKAGERAKQMKPRVKFVEFGTYTVQGISATYTVTFSKVQGECIVACTCVAGQKGRAYCYHIAACIGNHRLRVRDAALAPAFNGDTLAQHGLDVLEAVAA